MDETEEITVEVEGFVKDWLEVAAREYGLSKGDAGGTLLQYGLAHHDEAIQKNLD